MEQLVHQGLFFFCAKTFAKCKGFHVCVSFLPSVTFLGLARVDFLGLARVDFLGLARVRLDLLGLRVDLAK